MSDKLAKATDAPTQIIPSDVDLSGIQEAMADSGEKLGVQDFTKLKVPSGDGAPVFCIESVDGIQTPATVDCIIIDQQPINVYFDTPYDGDKVPPTCVSPDGIKGVGTPGGDCATCPKNQWQSDKNERGKACANRRHVLALVEGEVFPIFINMPPTSIKSFRTYLRGLIKKTLLMSNCITRIGLEKTKNENGLDYFSMTFTLVGTVTPEQKPLVKQYKEAMAGILAAQALSDPGIHNDERVDNFSVDEYTTEETPV